MFMKCCVFALIAAKNAVPSPVQPLTARNNFVEENNRHYSVKWGQKTETIFTRCVL